MTSARFINHLGEFYWHVDLVNKQKAEITRLRKAIEELTTPPEGDRPQSIGQGHRILHQMRKRIEELQLELAAEKACRETIQASAEGLQEQVAEGDRVFTETFDSMQHHLMDSQLYQKQVKQLQEQVKEYDKALELLETRNPVNSVEFARTERTRIAAMGGEV